MSLIIFYRFALGCSYAMCFSILLVKLMIILSSKNVGYLKGIFQVLMFIFAWGVQIVVDVEWLILRPPEVHMVSIYLQEILVKKEPYEANAYIKRKRNSVKHFTE